MMQDATEQQVKQLDASLDFFRRHSESGIDSALVEKQLLWMLNDMFPVLPCMPIKFRPPLNTIYRMTINKNVVGGHKRIGHVKYLQYPPIEKVLDYGRCNLKHESVFYGTFDHLTLFNEVRPKDGNLVTTSTWKAIEGESLLTCPIFKNQPSNGTFNPRTFRLNDLFEQHMEKHPPNIRLGTNKLFQFITDEFSKLVSSENRNYLFSAVYSNRVFNQLYDGTIEAIQYPSVQQKLSFDNIAIKAKVFNTKYEISEVSDGIVNGRFIEKLSTCNKFDNGKILWGTEYNIAQMQFENYQKMLNIDLQPLIN
jgi:hypothetical protein